MNEARARQNNPIAKNVTYSKYVPTLSAVRTMVRAVRPSAIALKAKDSVLIVLVFMGISFYLGLVFIPTRLLYKKPGTVVTVQKGNVRGEKVQVDHLNKKGCPKNPQLLPQYFFGEDNGGWVNRGGSRPAPTFETPQTYRLMIVYSRLRWRALATAWARPVTSSLV